MRVKKVISELEKGNLEKAQLLFEKLLKNGSNEERFELAEELQHLGFLFEAKQLYEKLLSQFPDEAELKILLAEILLEMDEEEAAIPYLDSVSETDEEYPQALLLLADLYQIQGLYEVSEQKLLQAQTILPDEPVITFALAELYNTNGDHVQAIDYYKALLEAKQTIIANVNIQGRLAEVLSSRGSFEEALPYYEQALKDNREINTLFNFAITLYQANLYKKAIQIFKELLSIDEEYHSLYLPLAKSYEQEEEIQDAYDTVKKGIAQDDFNKELFLLGGKLALKLKDETSAEDYLRNALVLDPGYIEAALTLNKLLLTHEKYEDVEEIVTLVEQNETSDPHLSWDMALALQHQEKYKESLKYYRDAYTDLKHHNDFLSDYGYFLLEEGAREEATQIFETLSKEDPTNEEWLLLLERLQEQY